MAICSSDAGNIAGGFARGQYYLSILPVEGEQIVMLLSHKGNN